jgi:hypothetical protein
LDPQPSIQVVFQCERSAVARLCAVADYAEYIRGFVHVRNQKIRDHVESALASGLLWPDPLIQLNPAFEAGDSIDELVESRILHDECANVFQKDKQPGPNNVGKALRLYKHQSDAIRVAVGGQNYVLTPLHARAERFETPLRARQQYRGWSTGVEGCWCGAHVRAEHFQTPLRARQQYWGWTTFVPASE